MKKAILITFFSFCSLVFSQVEVDTLQVKILDQKQGLLQLNIKGLTQDKNDFLWGGTEDGLHRFNSCEFIPYIHNPKDSLSISDDHIRDVKAVNDTLFIATNTKGIVGYQLSKNIFFNIFNNNKYNFTHKIIKLNKEKLLFSVKNNFILYNLKNKESEIIQLPKTTKENLVLDAQLVNAENILIATTNSGVLNFNVKTKELTPKFTKIKSANCVFKDEEKIFIGTENGLFISNQNTVKKTIIKEPVRCFYKKDNLLYVGTKKSVYKYDLVKNEITYLIFKSLKNKVYNPVEVLTILSDKKGNIWFGTEGEGLFYFSKYQKKFNTYKLKFKEFANIEKISSFNFLKNRDSTLWIGNSFGIAKYDLKTHASKVYKAGRHNVIYTIKRDKNGVVWVGGFGSGLLKYDSVKDKFKTYKFNKSIKKGIPDNEVIEIIPINKNKLWIATWTAGIHEFNIEKEEFLPVLIKNKQINRARISYIDSQENIWLGTDEGLYKITKEATFHFTSELPKTKKLSSNRIFNIKEDSKGNIWVGTSAGLTKIDKNYNTTIFYKQEGLPNDFIYSINIDDSDNIWVSTNYGISVLNVSTLKFKNYTDKDGLQNTEFNGKAGYQDEFGNFYFGGVDGFNIFSPKSINETPYTPKVYIESVELFNKPINKNEIFANSLTFKSSENVLTFNYVAVNFLNPEKVTYQYKMEGFDSNWRPITKDKSTTYTNLNPGEYTFKVKATNDIGIWNEKPTELKIQITPPWYAEWWAKLMFVLSLLAIVMLFYLRETTKLKRAKIALENIVAQRTLELTNKNKSLEKSYKTADEQRKNIQFLMKELNHRVRNNLQIISSLLNIQANSSANKETEEILKVAKNRILSIAHVQNILSSDSENVDLGEFIKEISSKIINTLSDENMLNFKTEYNIESVKNYPSTNTVLIGLILNELITNTCKYAFKTNDDKNLLTINCKKSKGVIKIEVSDNGVGYVKSKIRKNSLGLELISEMSRQLNAKLITKNGNGVTNIILIEC